MRSAPSETLRGWRVGSPSTDAFVHGGPIQSMSDEVASTHGCELDLMESMDWVLTRALPMQTASLPGEPFLAGPAWFGELTLHVGQVCGMLEAECVPVAVAYELAAAAMLSDDSRPHSGSLPASESGLTGTKLTPFRPAAWRMELLRDYVKAIGSRATPAACSVSRFAVDKWMIERCVWLVQECLAASVASVPAFRYNQAISAGSALGSCLALGFQSASTHFRAGFDEDELIVFTESAAAQAITIAVYEIVRARLAVSGTDGLALARVAAAMLEQARIERAYRQVVVHRSAFRIAADLSNLQWLQTRWEPKLQHVWHAMETDFRSLSKEPLD